MDYQLAQQYYQMAAERGCDAAKIRLGCLFEHGLGVYRNLEKAFACYQQADGTVARFHQGRCYRQGIGCSPNLAEAEYPLFRAFGMISGLRFMNMWRWQNQGSRPPNLNLGNRYSLGLDVETIQQNYPESLHWLQLAAKQQDRDAIYDLGRHFLYGRRA